MNRVLPLMTPPSAVTTPQLPLLKEWAYDFENERLLEVDGRMELLSGLDALKIWAYKAVRTELGRWPAYSANFGSEVETLIGQPYSEAFIQAETQRMLSEALLASPYILAVGRVEANMDDSVLRASINFDSVYGPSNVEVSV